MKKILRAIAVFAIIIGIQIVLLGGLYKIQSWSPPVVAGGELNLLLFGMLLASGGAMLMLSAKLMKKEERLELDPNRIPRTAEKEKEFLLDDDQYV